MSDEAESNIIILDNIFLEQSNESQAIAFAIVAIQQNEAAILKCKEQIIDGATAIYPKYSQGYIDASKKILKILEGT